MYRRESRTFKVPFYATTPSQPSAAQTLKMLWRILRTMLQRLFLKSKFVKVSVKLYCSSCSPLDPPFCLAKPSMTHNLLHRPPPHNSIGKNVHFHNSRYTTASEYMLLEWSHVHCALCSVGHSARCFVTFTGCRIAVDLPFLLLPPSLPCYNGNYAHWGVAHMASYGMCYISKVFHYIIRAYLAYSILMLGIWPCSIFLLCWRPSPIDHAFYTTSA